MGLPEPYCEPKDLSTKDIEQFMRTPPEGVPSNYLERLYKIPFPEETKSAYLRQLLTEYLQKYEEENNEVSKLQICLDEKMRHPHQSNFEHLGPSKSNIPSSDKKASEGAQLQPEFIGDLYYFHQSAMPEKELETMRMNADPFWRKILEITLTDHEQRTRIPSGAKKQARELETPLPKHSHSEEANRKYQADGQTSTDFCEAGTESKYQGEMPGQHSNVPLSFLPEQQNSDSKPEDKSELDGDNDKYQQIITLSQAVKEAYSRSKATLPNQRSYIDYADKKFDEATTNQFTKLNKCKVEGAEEYVKEDEKGESESLDKFSCESLVINSHPIPKSSTNETMSKEGWVPILGHYSNLYATMQMFSPLNS